MIINNEYKFIFIHIPKTSGTRLNTVIKKKYPMSIQLIYVDKDTGIDCMHLHSDVLDKYIKKHLLHLSDKKYYDNYSKEKYNKFCIVRNPYNKIYSAWHSLKKRYGYDNVNDFIKYKLSKEYIYDTDNTNRDAKAHFRPQYTFVYNNDKQLIVDYIIIYEKLNEDIKEVNKLFVLDIPTYANDNISKSYIDRLNMESITKINLLYKDDFELLGYKMINPDDI